MVKKNETWTLSCDRGCGKSISITNTQQATGWEIDRGCYSTDPAREIASIRKVLCPDCAEKKRWAMYRSANIRERLEAGYYKDHPEKWEDDVLKHLGIVGHPKAATLLSIAYDKGHSGGYGEMLNEAESMVELLK